MVLALTAGGFNVMADWTESNQTEFCRGFISMWSPGDL